MNQSDLIAKMADLFPHLKIKDVELGVKSIVAQLASTIAQGRRVEIRGFGSFWLIYRQPRIARNPKSGAKFLMPGKYTPRFKPGKTLKEYVVGNKRL